MIKEYLERKWLWVDKNPRLASWLGWIKGLILGLLIYHLLNTFNNYIIYYEKFLLFICCITHIFMFRE